MGGEGGGRRVHNEEGILWRHEFNEVIPFMLYTRASGSVPCYLCLEVGDQGRACHLYQHLFKCLLVLEMGFGIGYGIQFGKESLVCIYIVVAVYS